jgi:hypothetical protein
MTKPMECIGCGRRPEEIPEYVYAATEEDMTPSEYVETEEGTYNEVTGAFACDSCYIAMGVPSLPEGWKA